MRRYKNHNKVTVQQQRAPGVANVCHSCGTRYGEIGFESQIEVIQGVCWCCGKAGAVSRASDYGCLPYLPRGILLLKPAPHKVVEG